MIVLAVAGVRQGAYAGSPSTPAAPAPASPTPTAASIVTRLAGANEVPPNKSTATGTARIIVDVLHDQVCWNLSIQQPQGTVTEAHIHRGPAGKEGPVVLGLSPPVGGSSHGCRRAEPSLAHDLVSHPGAYYVNVHSSKFPGGEIRGQL